MGVNDRSVFDRFEQDEAEKPLPRKELEGRTIYMSRPIGLTRGAPSITDLSEARFDGPKNIDQTMPNVYRAPEIILDHPWSFPADIWGFAQVVSLCSHTFDI